MSDVVLVAIIAAIPGTIAAILTVIGNKKTDAIAISVDGRLSQLLEAKSAESRATGRAAGVEAERVRVEAERPLP